MRKFLSLAIALFAALSCLISCGKGNNDNNEGQTYVVKGTVSLDSSWVINNKLVLFSDNHRALSQDTILLSNEGTFEFKGHANGLDELYLCGEKGELCRFYASGNMEINLSIVVTEEEGVKVQHLGLQHDTINGWLQEKKALFDDKSSGICRLIMDSLVKDNPNDLRVTLLLRDMMPAINDSLFIRQSLGSLADNAKPDWMKKSIDNTLNVLGSGKTPTNYRLAAPTFELADTIIDFATSHSDYTLICFWADYSKPSIDSLRALAKLISSEYENKRVSFLSCCLHAEDSSMWRIRTNFVDGDHTWIKGGFSDSRMRAWDIKEVPSVILMDMYCNQTKRNVWGGELRMALDRLPNRLNATKK